METNNTDTRKAALLWWDTISEFGKYALCQQYFMGIAPSTLMDKSIEAMYHYEHPSPTAAIEGKKEEAGEFTVGKMYKGSVLVENESQVLCRLFAHDYNSDEETEKSAKRIVMAVNGWDKLTEDLAFAMDLAHRENGIVKKLEGEKDALVSALKSLLDVAQHSSEQYAFVNEIEAAKELLNNLKS